MTEREAGELKMARDLAQAALAFSDHLGGESAVALLVTAAIIAAGLDDHPDRRLERAIQSINEARAIRFAAARERRRTA